jgi:hypothetical protein
MAIGMCLLASPLLKDQGEGPALTPSVNLWRRDLVANMIGHGLVDFVANVLPQLFS